MKKQSIVTSLDVVESGIGKVNAAVAVTLLIERYKPDLIINAGTSGAFAEGLKVGDVVVATQYRYGDVDATCFGYEYGEVPQMPAKYDLDDNWLDVGQGEAAAEADDLPYSLDFGLILTLDSFMSESDGVERLNRLFLPLRYQIWRDLPSFKLLPNMVFRCYHQGGIGYYRSWRRYG